MVLLELAFKSLRNRVFATSLTVISIALSVSLLLSVERAKRAAEEGFTQTISKTDLIVGARSGSLQLLLYTVFNMGSATNNVSWKSYQELKKNPAIGWTIPYSLGDAHRGFRVVGTNEDFFKYYHFRGDQRIELQSGRILEGLWDVVVGADVVKKLNYHLGDKIIVSHGITKGEGVVHHGDKPFEIVGIMKQTGTPLDRAVYMSLEGGEALHIDWKDGAMPTRDKMIPANQIRKEDLVVDEITAFFVGAKSRIDTLRLQREINDYKPEPLMAIIPGVALSELWGGLSYAEKVLRIISWMVVVVGFMAMLIALTTTLNERRREMAILRALGARSSQLVGLLVFESAVLTFLGVALGVGLSVGLIALLKPWLESEFGLFLGGPALTGFDFLLILITFSGGTLMGLIPALRAQKMALKDGLSVKL